MKFSRSIVGYLSQSLGSCKWVSRVLVVAFVFVFAGCRTTQDGHEPEATVYRIQPGDVVRIDVYKEADISLPFDVSDSGYINHPLLGKVKIAGMTVAEVETRIYNMLAADYLVNPIVTVSIASSSDRPLMIFGEVRNPGSYALEAGRSNTLLELIARAGGFTDIANRNKVRIVRKENGKTKTIKVRISDLFKQRNGISDINLKPGDVITVPETTF